MFEHHYGTPERADGVCDIFAGDIERRPVDRFEHRRRATRGIDIRRWRDTDAACKRCGKIA